MAVQTAKPTVEDFDRFVEQPENEDRRFEYIGGEIIEVPSNPYSSYIAAKILIELGIYLKTNPIGFVTGEAGGYQVSGERYAPDVAFISKARQPQLPRTGYNPLAPDLAVEVFSPTDTERKLSIKVSNYLAAGTTVVVVYPEDAEVVVHRPGQPVDVLGRDDTFDAGDVLPGFTLAVAEMVPTASEDDA